MTKLVHNQVTLKTIYHRINNGTTGRSGSSGSLVTLPGSNFNYTSGPVAETLHLQFMIMANVGSGATTQQWLYANGVRRGSGTYFNTNGTWDVQTILVPPFSIPANTTWAINLQHQGGSGTTIANASGDVDLYPCEIVGFARAT